MPTFLHQTHLPSSHPSDSVDEALSMSMEYLSNVSDVNDIFQDSLMTCLELSSQIANLADRMRDLSRHEVRDLLNMKRL